VKIIHYDKKQENLIVTMDGFGLLTLSQFEIPLDRICPFQIGHIVSSNNAPNGDIFLSLVNGDVFLSLACFYYNTDNYAACYYAYQKALENGIPENKVEKYKTWVQKKEERIKAIEDKENLLRKDRKIKGINKKAWKILDSLIQAFKENNEVTVFVQLDTLKSLYKEDSEELRSLNSQFEKKEGLSLGDIAETVFLKCFECKGSGKKNCDRCNGKGDLCHTKRIKTASNRQTSPERCANCNGMGSTECQACYKKRNNFNYLHITSFCKKLSSEPEKK